MPEAELLLPENAQPGGKAGAAASARSTCREVQGTVWRERRATSPSLGAREDFQRGDILATFVWKIKT